MANTYTLIASNTLTGTAASVTFSSIPATYDDLSLQISSRIDQAQSGIWIDLYFNSDTSGSSTNYSTTRLTGNGSTAASGRVSSDDQIKLVTATEGTNMTASTFASTQIYIPSYKVNQNKPLSAFSVAETNSTASTLGVTAGLWRNATAITQIVIYPDNSTGNFVSGSSFWLYGISNT